MIDRCEKFKVFMAVEAAFKAGDLEGLRTALGNPEGFPNVRGPEGIGCSLLQYAIYHSPLGFIRMLLEQGADPNYDNGDGFPCLMAALSSSPAQGVPGRDDVLAVLELLLSFGADVQQRGINDYTPLHEAVARGDVYAVELLLRYGADIDARTTIDDFETPIEIAERARLVQLVEMLRSG